MNDLPFELFVAFRYLLAKRKQAFISLISFISVIGVSVGVMAVLIAMALMTGLQKELRERIVGSSAHVYVFKLEGIRDVAAEVAKLKQIPRVLGAAPAVLGKGMLNAGAAPDQNAFVTVKGIDPALEGTVTDIRRAMRQGSIDAIRVGPEEMDGIVLGIDLAKNLEVKVGDTVRLFSPEQVLTPFAPMTRTRAFKVVGIFSLGLFEFDSEYALVDLPVAARVFGKPMPADFIQLRLDDMFASQGVAEDIPQRLGEEYATQDWAQMNRALFNALWLEKMAISITIGLIIMVAALNIIASLVLLVMEKNRDIAILKTMGSSAASIRRIFMLQGLIIGLVGTGGGTIGGVGIIYILDRYKLIHVPIDVYQISYVPFTLLPLDLLSVVLAAVLICFVATIYPSRQASKLDPAQALRYQ
jgi:lipoprotein-releasing system permease protein